MMWGLIVVELMAILVLRKFFTRSLLELGMRLLESSRAVIWFYSVLTLPGLIIHEISHFLVAALTGLRTGTIELLPRMGKLGNVEFGSVQVEKADPLRLVLVGMAPLISGLPLIAWMSLNLNKQPLLWGYLITTTTLHMLPSKKDLTYWPMIVLLLAGCWWLSIKLPPNNYLMQSIVMGLKMPILVLMGGWILLTGINLMFKRRIIVK